MIQICLSFYAAAVSSQDKITTSILHPTRRHSSIVGLLKQTRPNTLKRSPPLFSSPLTSRILNKKTPLNVLQNGPYYINHYIYCDNLDHHTLEQIKSGTFSSDQQIQLLNLQKDKFHGFSSLTPSLDSLESVGFTASLDQFKPSSYISDKEIHILHLPKNKPQGLDDINLLGAHQAPEIDLELNKNLDNFEVNLPSIKPAELDSSYLPTAATPSLNEIVTPLIQGHIPGGIPPKYNINLDQITHYLSENKHGKDGFLQYSSSYESGSKEVLDVPHFEQHPLEDDHSKSSYDTPGAVDSYGHPVSNSHTSQSNNNFYSSESGISSNQYSGELKNEDVFQTIDYFNQLNEIHDFNRKRRQETKAETTEDKTGEEVRYPNHKYD